jgi:hypothetical protein
MNINEKERKIEKPVNCWQYMSCGREPGGAHTDLFGVCPASTDNRLDGVHGGKNAGRACWAIAGSFTKDGDEMALAGGHRDCAACDFYNAVQQEEGRYTWPTAFLQKLLVGKKMDRRSCCNRKV